MSMPPLYVDMTRQNICLNCGDNRAEDDSVLCATCDQNMMMGGYKGDGL